jgi:gliding motility-associated-like protein
MSGQRLWIWCCFVLGFFPILYENANAQQHYLPPSIYRTLSTRHRSYFPQPTSRDLKISAHVACAHELQPLVTLFYRLNGDDFRPKPMFENTDEFWQTIIPAEEISGSVFSYYFQVHDSETIVTDPINNPQTRPYIIEIDSSIDSEAPPLIELMPRSQKLASITQCKQENILLSAYVVDNSALPADKTKIRYNIDQNDENLFGDMEARSDYLWNILIPEEALSNSLKLNILTTNSSTLDTTSWPATDDAPFTVNTNSFECSIVPPFISLTNEAKKITMEAGADFHSSGEEIKIEVSVASLGPLLEGAVNLYYQSSFMTDYVKTGFEQSKIDSIWTATIPANGVVDPILKFYVELVQGNDEITDPIWKERLRYYNIPVKASNTPPIITRTVSTVALSDTTQQADEDIVIQAIIVDMLGPDVESAAVFIIDEQSQSPTRLAMTAVRDSIWEAVIPRTLVNPDSISYFIWASDSIDSSTAPDRSTILDSAYVIHIKYFNAPPIITRTEETVALGETAQLAKQYLTIKAAIVDTLGPDVESATLHYLSGGNEYEHPKMDNVSDSTWMAVIPASDVLPDSIFYYITATDGSLSTSDPKVEDPKESAYAIAVYTPNEKPVIIHDPINNSIADSSVEISAIVIDTTKNVQWVNLYYKNIDQNEFQLLPMNTVNGEIYQASIPAEDVIVNYVDYFLKAKGAFSDSDTTQTPLYRINVFTDYDVRPNPFTPNNDNFNDKVHFNISGIENGGEVILYNRRGREIRKLVGGEDWNGKDSGGKDLPPGIYLYAVSIDGSVQHSGVITLIR